MSTIALEVVIGLVFVFWVLSLAAAGITEAIAGLTSKRGAELARGLAAMLGGKGPATSWTRLWRRLRRSSKPVSEGLVGKVLAHPLIAAMGQPRLAEKPSTAGSPPSYIPSAAFARALLDLIEKGGTPVEKPADAVDAVDAAAPADGALVDRLTAAVASLTATPAVKKQLGILVAEAAAATGDTLTELRKGIETWFDDQMDRVSGWYKRWAKKVAFGIGAILVVALNADAISMTTTLWREPTVRAALVAQADAACPEPAAGEAETAVDCTAAVDELRTAGLPLGWDCPEDEGTAAGRADRSWRNCVDDGGERAQRVAGWLITALAITLGAPFWFDTLGKLGSLRSAGRKPERADAATGSG